MHIETQRIATPPMDNWKSPNREHKPTPMDMPLEERLRALEAQVARHQAPTGTTTAPNATVQQAWPPGMGMPKEPPSVARLATVSADLDAHRDQLRNAEMSLVDRIADVDDERRRATARLQKAWQTHRDEVDVQLRRHTWLIVALLTLFTALIGGALFFAYRLVDDGQLQLASEPTEIKSGLERVPASDPRPDQQDPESARLSARLDELSLTVAKLSEQWQQVETAPAPDQQPAPDAQLTAEIRQLEDRQQLAAQELASLRQALGEAKTADNERTAAIDEGIPGSEDAQPVIEPEPDTDATVNDDAPDQGTDMESAITGQGNDAQDMTSAEVETVGSVGNTGTAPSVEQRTVVISEQPFALQLVSFRSRQSLMRFANREDLPSPTYYRQETYRGRPWFVLIHSLHDTADDAANGLAQLPQGLATQVDPWIRALNEGSELMVIENPQGN